MAKLVPGRLLIDLPVIVHFSIATAPPVIITPHKKCTDTKRAPSAPRTSGPPYLSPPVSSTPSCPTTVTPAASSSGP